MSDLPDLDSRIASLAVLKTQDLRARVGQLAKELGPNAVTSLRKRLNEPAVTAQEAGLEKMFHFEWGGRWNATIMELLGALGPAGAEVLWTFADDPNDFIASRALIVLFRMPVLTSGQEFEELVAGLRQRLPKFYRKEIPLAPILSSLLTESRTEPRLLDVLSALREVKILETKKKTYVLGDYVQRVLNPPPPPSKPAELPEHRRFANHFADLIVAHDLKSAVALFLPPFQEKMPLESMEKTLVEMSSHCGWPASHEGAEYGGMRTEELRGKRSKYEPSLPKFVKDEDFRNWMWIRFLPKEGSDSDFAFDLGVALVESRGELKVGYIWATAED